MIHVICVFEELNCQNDETDDYDRDADERNLCLKKSLCSLSGAEALGCIRATMMVRKNYIQSFHQEYKMFHSNLFGL